jgi:probable HAF family extracellular repeat protein
MKTSASLLAFRSFLLLLLAAFSLLLPSGAAADPLFTIIGLGGLNSHAYGINNSGTVVGGYGATSYPFDQQRPFIWQNGALTELPVPDNSLGRGAAFAISDSGYIAGTTEGGGNDYEGTVWYNGQLLPQRVPGPDYAQLTDINNSGVSVATFDSSSSGFSSGECFAGDMNCIIPPLLPYYTTLLGINNSGELVGATFNHPTNSQSAAVSYKNGTVTTLFPNAGSTQSVAIAVNNSGSIAGSYDGSAFLLDGGRDINLGFAIPVNTGLSVTWAGNPLAINDWGEVVGDQYIWYGGQLYNVNNLLPANSGWTITEVDGVNNSGQIVGTGIYNGQTEAFIANPVPEPGSITLLVTGLATCLFLLRKRVLA